MPRSSNLIYIALCVLITFMMPVPRANAEDFRYDFVAGPRSREFNLITTLTANSDTPQARVFFCTRDLENTYRLDITGDSLRFFRVEMGMELPIGTISEAGLEGRKPHRLIIKRRRTTITAVLDGLVVAEAYDQTFTRGQIGVGIRGDSVTFGQDFRTYACGDIYFADDFMTINATAWNPQTGRWSVLETASPTMSANPFKYTGRSREAGFGNAALTVPRNDSFIHWDNYSAMVSFQDESGAPVGLVFYYTSPRDYYLFRWSGRNSESPVRQIVRVHDGTETVLASEPGGYIPGVWYKLQVDVRGTTATAIVDENSLLTINDDRLVGGSIGLYTESTRGTLFDDLLARGMIGSFEDNFVTPCPGRWLELGGSWSVGDGTMTAAARRAAKAVTGDPRWRNYHVKTTIASPSEGAAGIAFYYQDELNHFLYRANADGTREVVRFFDGESKVLDSVAHPWAENERTVVSNADGLIRVRVNGKQIIETFDEGLWEGQIGLYVERDNVKFGPVEVFTPPPAEPVPSLGDRIFQDEAQMQVFASDQRDWIPSGKTDRHGREWAWHRANLFGDTSIELTMREEPFDDGTLQLALAAQSADPTTGVDDSGYVLNVWKAGVWHMSISRKGVEIARAATVFRDNIERVEFSRRGSYLFGRINRKLEIWVKDDEPLRGNRAGYAALPAVAKNIRSNVFCPNLLTYTFSRSPVDWRSAGGKWEVAARWACDPRWSWFSGVQHGGAAVTWNKLAFSGDFAIEFCGAIMMDTERGSEYRFARDMNVTIGADGKDLTSGYSFIFGGWGNTQTALTRGTEIVARPNEPTRNRFLRTSDEHHTWYYHKIERDGNTLRWLIDNRLVLEYTDPEPLTGDRIALWFYDIGIIAARVRIAAEEIGGLEHPDFAPERPPANIYDYIPEAKE